MPILLILLQSPFTALAAPPESPAVLQVSTWSEAQCTPELVRPDADEPQRHTLDGATTALATLHAMHRPGACHTPVVEVFSLDPAWVAIDCSAEAEVHVVRTTSPWTERRTRVTVYEGGALLPLPYYGEGPYHTLRAAIVPVNPGEPVVCSVSGAERTGG